MGDVTMTRSIFIYSPWFQLRIDSNCAFLPDTQSACIEIIIHSYYSHTGGGKLRV